MQFGKVFSSNADMMRCKIVAYASDGALQDKLLKFENSIPADLIVGDVVDVSTGAKATATTGTLAVVVEPSIAGDKTIIIANPVHTILSKAGLETTLPLEDVVEALEALGYTFSDFGNVPLRTI